MDKHSLLQQAIARAQAVSLTDFVSISKICTDADGLKKRIALNPGRGIRAVTLSDLLNRAAAHSLIHREGMAAGGVKFARYETYVAADSVVKNEDSMAVLTHVFQHASRARNIIANPKGYEPRISAQYGGRIAGFKPLFE